MPRHFKAAKQSLIIMLFCAVLLLIDSVVSINQFGIMPRNINHLWGILVSPFLHGDWMHLSSNFFPFVIFSTLIGMYSLKRFWMVFVFSIICSGSLVWLLARGDSVHIGMSGVVYAMWGYLIVFGFMQRKFVNILIAIIVLVVYGGLVMGVLPTQPNISYESHLLGMLSGAFLGYYLAKSRR